MKDRELAEAWSAKNAVNFYLTHRDSIDGLYDSERHFLENAVKNGGSLLDIGCAAGGFSKIVITYNRDISYTGVDISPAMITAAKKKFPQNKFFLFNGKKLSFPNESFDICVAFGVLPMTERWIELLKEAWRVCRGTLLFDLRLAEKDGVADAKLSYQRIEFEGVWDGVSKTPYVVVNADEAADVIRSLRPGAKSVTAYGYWHDVSKSTVSVYKNVCMSTFCLEKRGKSSPVEWKLPLDIPDRLKQRLVE